MKFRKLGRTDITVSEVGLGTWELSGDVWGKKDDAVSLRALEAGLDRGATFIDTAAGYGKGHVEELLATLWTGGSRRRDAVVISTKVKPECGQFAPPPERDIVDFYRPAWIVDQCEASLQRLQTDYIDVLFLHTWSRAWGHETAWYDALLKLKSQGKIRAFGISVPDEGITDANVQIALGLVDAVQCVFSAFQQEPLYSLLPLARKHSVGIVARSPFSSGALVQNWSAGMQFPDGDWRATWPLSVKPGWLEEQSRMSAKLKPTLLETGLDYASAALAFVLASPDVSTVIPGSADPTHAAQNVASNGLVLPPASMDKIRKLWIDHEVHGTYNGSI